MHQEPIGYAEVPSYDYQVSFVAFSPKSTQETLLLKLRGKNIGISGRAVALIMLALDFGRIQT
jgi:hypothetical protein